MTALLKYCIYDQVVWWFILRVFWFWNVWKVFGIKISCRCVTALVIRVPIQICCYTSHHGICAFHIFSVVYSLTSVFTWIMSVLVSLKVLGMLLHTVSAILTSHILCVRLIGSVSCSEDFHVTCTETSTIIGKNPAFQYLLYELICLEVYLIDNRFIYMLFSSVSCIP